MDGYWEKILRVDLTHGIADEERIDKLVYKNFLGGAGIGTKFLYEEVAQKVEAFDPDNRIIFSVGPFQGTKLPGSAKWSVTSKSPLTGTYGESAAGAAWGVMLKKVGYDALVIEGRANKPTYLWIHDDGVEIRDASGLWGVDASETPRKLRDEVGEPRASIATIGPAGEKLVHIACIVVDGHSFAGRCGLGAVMGSKNLKAIAVYGTKYVQVFDPDEVDRLTKELSMKISKFAKDLKEHGTPIGMTVYESFGDVPIKYWSGDTWSEGAKKIGSPRYTEVLNARPLPCLYCPIGCHRHIEIDDLPKYMLKGFGPHYETLAMLGANCLIDDLKAISKANDICTRLGIDTISAGASVAFAMECFERGWLTKKDTKGMDIKWGDGDVLIELVRQIGMKEGFGELFCEGTLRAAKKIGKGAEDMVIHVRGLDFPAHDPRACFSLAVNYATGTRGACHERGMPEDIEVGAFLLPELGITEQPKFFDPEGKASLAVKLQDFAAVLNSLVICNFILDGGGMSLTETLACLNAITGWNWSIEELMKVGERIFNLQRLINMRDGMGKDYDKLPRRMFEPAKKGFRKGQISPFNVMLNEYYKLRGWGTDGAPTMDKLKELKLIVDSNASS